MAWNRSARAARAFGNALPFLRAAEAVEVVSVTGDKEVPDTIEDADNTPHLTRHGVSVRVRSVPARNGDAALTLRDTATLFRADMLVMGGYVHSRLREMFFGGVTQSLLKASPVPLVHVSLMLPRSSGLYAICAITASHQTEKSLQCLR